jgi:hypothetical protein
MSVFKIEPEKVHIFWNLIKPGIILSDMVIGVNGWEAANNIFEACQAGKAQAWIVLDKEEKLSATFITTIMNEEISKERVLLIYLLYSYKTIDDEDWYTAFEKVYKFMKNRNCNRLTFYSNNARIDEKAHEVLGSAVKKVTLYSYQIK